MSCRRTLKEGFRSFRADFLIFPSCPYYNISFLLRIGDSTSYSEFPAACRRRTQAKKGKGCTDTNSVDVHEPAGKEKKNRTVPFSYSLVWLYFSRDFM
jgi:hypothetical protein